MTSHTADVRFTIRDYRAADFQRLWEIDQICFAPGIAYTQMDLTGFLAGRKRIALVAEPAESDTSASALARIAGFLIANSRAKAGRVLTIDVLPEARGHGLGSVLMKECELRLSQQGCTEVYLETAVNNEPALQLYSKLGYKILRTLPKYYSSHSLDAFLLGKSL